MAGSITSIYRCKKSLYISRVFRPRIADALQILIGEGVSEVLLALQNLFLDELGPGPSAAGSVQEIIAYRSPYCRFTPGGYF